MGITNLHLQPFRERETEGPDYRALGDALNIQSWRDWPGLVRFVVITHSYPTTEGLPIRIPEYLSPTCSRMIHPHAPVARWVIPSLIPIFLYHIQSLKLLSHLWGLQEAAAVSSTSHDPESRLWLLILSDAWLWHLRPLIQLWILLLAWSSALIVSDEKQDSDLS